MVWHPQKYAGLLAKQMRAHGTTAWLINTGWSGGAYGTGKRMSLAPQRASGAPEAGHPLDGLTAAGKGRASRFALTRTLDLCYKFGV
jgi:hypothetical protein